MGWFTGDKGGIEKISTLSPEQQKLMEQMYGFTSERIGVGLPGWEGDWTAPLTEGEEFGIGKYKEAITGMQPEEVSDWYMKYIAPGEQKYLEEVSIPTFKESMVPGGTLRSTGTERGIADIVSKFGTEQLGRIGETIMGERARATGALPGYMQAAGLQRFIEQDELNKQYAEFVRTTPELSPILGLVMEILNTTTQAAFYRPGTEGALSGILSGLAQGVGGALGGGIGSLFAKKDTTKQ